VGFQLSGGCLVRLGLRQGTKEEIEEEGAC